MSEQDVFSAEKKASRRYFETLDALEKVRASCNSSEVELQLAKQAEQVAWAEGVEKQNRLQRTSRLNCFDPI